MCFLLSVRPTNVARLTQRHLMAAMW
jgi:hypothetical protein